MNFILKNIFISFAAIFMLVACNPSKQLNKAVAERKKQEVKVQFPQQQVMTPANVNFVYDYDQLYTQQEEKTLDSLLRTFEKSNLISIQLVTQNNLSMQNADFDANNAQLYKDWDKVHGGSGRVMVVTINKGLQKAKADYGPYVAKLLPETQVSAIIDANRPIIERGDFFEATWNGLNQIMDAIRKNISSRQP